MEGYRCLSILITFGGGGLTLSGFFDMMDHMFTTNSTPNFTIQITNDNTPILPSDTVVSPLIKSIVNLHNYIYSHDPITGERVFLSGNIDKNNLINNQEIYRIGLIGKAGSLIYLIYFDKAIVFGNIDEFIVEFYIGFINTNSPKEILNIIIYSPPPQRRFFLGFSIILSTCLTIATYNCPSTGIVNYNPS